MASTNLNIVLSPDDIESISNLETSSTDGCYDVELHSIAANITIVSDSIDSQSILEKSSSTSNESKLSSDESININVESKEELQKIFCYLIDKIEIMETNLRNQSEINEQIKQRNNALGKKYDLLSKINRSLEQEVSFLTDTLYNIECRTIHNEQYSRRENIIISGIPDIINQNHLEGKVLEILRTIGLNSISSYDIAACHRLRKKSKNYPAHTIIRFTNRKNAKFCLYYRDRLQECRNVLKMNLKI